MKKYTYKNKKGYIASDKELVNLKFIGFVLSVNKDGPLDGLMHIDCVVDKEIYPRFKWWIKRTDYLRYKTKISEIL